MPKGDFGDRLQISNRRERNALDRMASLFLAGAIGCAVFLGVERLAPLDEAVLGRHSKNYKAKPKIEHTEIMEEEEVEDLPKESALLKTWREISELDRKWLDSIIEKAIKNAK